MAEATQVETLVTTAMEENSLESDSEGIEEEEDCELPIIVNKEKIDNVKQVACDDGDCQDISESDEDLDGFQLVEYKDPLTEDTSDNFKRRYDKGLSEISLLRFASRDDPPGCGVSGLMKKLSAEDNETVRDSDGEH